MTSYTETAPKSYCRSCGGGREHTILSQHERPWDNDEGLWGGDAWLTLECNGCRTVTFLHRHWFSEETDDRGAPITNSDLYPPSPTRRAPEWGLDFYLSLRSQDYWIIKLHSDIYAALGLKAHSLATMGIRAIVDFTVSSKVGDKGSFAEKLNRMLAENLITETQLGIIDAAFDAGSAAAHRGYAPAEADMYLLLDVAESLLEKVYIAPARDRRRAKQAEEMRQRTPRRS